MFGIDVHIYESQYEHVKELLKRESRKLPTVKINTDKKDILDFKPEDFTLEDYDPHPKMVIPTPI